MTPTNLPTTAALITIGSWALGYTDSVGLAMAGIVIQDQKDIGTAVGIAGCIRNTISTIGTAIYSVSLGYHTHRFFTWQRSLTGSHRSS